MNIWLIYPYGNIPGEGKRPDRPHMVADALVAAGHKVTWWASCFDHGSKKFRSRVWKDINVSDDFTIRLVPTTGYKRHISYKRIAHEKIYSKQIYAYANKVISPDLIILSEPALFRGKPIIKLVEEKNCLLMLDMLDQWPELFNVILPKPFKPFGKLLFKPWYDARRKLFQKADGIITVSNSYMDVVQGIIPKFPVENSEIVYFGTDVVKQRAEMKASPILPSPLENIIKSKGELWAIYASTLGNNYDLDTLLDAAKLLEDRNVNVKILIAGIGPLQDYVVSFINENKLTQAVYIGNPRSETVSSIFSYCDIGLSMYSKDSSVTMPVKAFHYFAAGLPIINSLVGDLSSLLLTYNAGLNYEAEDSESLVNAIQLLASDQKKREIMANNSYDLASDFDIKIQYRKVAELVETIARKNNKFDK
jgi:glycosyltransferase involved in cell wall biosynthesis